MCFEIRIGFFHTGRGEDDDSGEGNCGAPHRRETLYFSVFFDYEPSSISPEKRWCVNKIFILNNFFYTTLFIFQSLVPARPALKKFQCMIVKLPDATFFLLNFVSDFFPCFRKVGISKITGMPFPEKIMIGI